MQIGFFVQGEGKHLEIAKHLIASAQRVMPGTDLYQLTDASTPCLEGAQAIRLDGDLPMAVRRLTLHASLPGEWLFIDTDCVIQKDVSHVFADDFDIAVTDRKGSLWDGTPYAKLMPYNMGVTFSRSPEVWAQALDVLKTMSPKYQQWEGDQMVVCELTKQWNTKVLPGHVYNFTPANRDDSREHAAIVHYKGVRKAWLANDY